MRLPVSALPARSLVIAPQFIEAIESFVRAQTGDPTRLYRLCGISQEALQRDAILISPQQLMDVFALAAECALPSEPLSLQILRHMPVTAMGQMGMAAMTAETLDAALAVGIRYMPLVFPVFDLQKVEAGNQVSIIFSLRPEFANLTMPVLAEIQAGMFNKMGFFAKHGPAIMSANTLVGMAAHFAHAPQGHEAAYLRFFGVTAQFNAPENRFVMSRHTLKLPLMTHNRSNHAYLCSALQQRLQAHPEHHSTTLRVQQILRAGLQEACLPTAQQVADGLCVSARTLSRRLLSEGSSLSRLVDEARIELAERLIFGSDDNLALIAKKLGYSDLASFSRAFKRVKGCSPSVLRQSYDH